MTEDEKRIVDAYLAEIEAGEPTWNSPFYYVRYLRRMLRGIKPENAAWAQGQRSTTLDPLP